MSEEISRVGLCMQMCPAEEIKRREKQNLIHQFEKCEVVNHYNSESRKNTMETNRCKGRADHSKMVKEFQRSAAGKRMPTREDIRPPEILEKTTFYLIDNWLFAYDFVLDRLKAVRQDLVMQSLWGETSCNILQCAVRFHLYSAYRGCEDKSNQFDPHLNYSNLHECLTRLVVLRSNLNEQDTFERAEAEAVYLIHNLGSAEVLRRAVGLQNKILCHELVKMAVDLNMAWMKRNFIRVMRIVKRLPFMLLCALLPHVEEIRRSTLAIMSSAYSCKNVTFPIGQLSTILLCDVGECKDLCKYYGITISGDGTSAVFRKEQFLGTKLPPSSHQYKFMKQRHGDADLRKLLRGLY